MEYELPTIRSTMAGFSNLAKLHEATQALFNDHLDVNFSKCGFFDGNMTAALQVILERVADQGNTVGLIDFPPVLYSFLCKNQFLCQYGHAQIIDSNKTALPHKSFHRLDSAEFASYLNEHLPGKGIPTMTEGLGKKFRQSIFEIFQNCVMHSRSTAGVIVSGQFYPKEHHLDLTIADAGVGIRTNVRQFLRNQISSVDAIKWAMIEGNTTKTGNQPGGFGLKLLQEFIELNKGMVQIASRDGFYQFSSGLKRYETLKADFPGTSINFQINTSDTKSYGLRSEFSPKNIFQ